MSLDTNIRLSVLSHFKAIFSKYDEIAATKAILDEYNPSAGEDVQNVIHEKRLEKTMGYQLHKIQAQKRIPEIKLVRF